MTIVYNPEDWAMRLVKMDFTEGVSMHYTTQFTFECRRHGIRMGECDECGKRVAVIHNEAPQA
jgi:hypothetical protein